MKTRAGTIYGFTGVLFLLLMSYGFQGQAWGDTAPLLQTDLQISTGQCEPSKAAAAFDGNRFLVVWTQYNDGYSYDIYARFLTSAGACDGDPFLISTIHNANIQDNPAVAFNGTNYLVVWYSNTDPGYEAILGKTVSVGGALGQETVICAQDATTPQVASDGANFLVVWGDHRNTETSGDYGNIYGQMVSGSGTLQGTNFRISPLPGYQDYPAIAYGGGRYLATWLNSDVLNVPADLYAAFVDTSGTVSAAFPLSTAPGSQANWMPAGISYDGTNFLVVWEDNNGNDQIYGNRVTPNGSLLDGDAATGGFLIASGSNVGSGSPIGPQAVFEGADWLVVWAASTIRGVRVSSQGQVLDPDPIPLYKSVSDINGALYAGMAFDGHSNSLVTWSSGETNFTKYAQLIGPNPLTANAGPDQTVQAGATVRLNGSNSTPADDIVSYQWTQLSGPAATLSDPTVVNPTFTAPVVGPNGASLQFQLTVTDQGGQTSQAACTVTVTFANQAPLANAGTNQTVKAGDSVTLDGSGSADLDDGIASYKWLQTGGPSVQLSDTTAVSPTFTAPVVGSAGAALTFQLTVTDNGGLTATATTIVNVTWINQPPVANAGADQTVNSGATVTLDGSASTDPDDGIATYQWTQKSGPPVTLSTPGAVQCTFTAPNVTKAGQACTFLLTVTDKGGLQSTSLCTINVQWVDTPPVVSAGDNVFILTKDQAATVITGIAADADGDPLTYTWSEGNTQLAAGPVGPDGSAPLSLAALPTLSVGGHTLTLAVNDGYVTVLGSVLLTVENSPPTIAPTGEGTYQMGAPVILGGQVSDYDGDPITYTWLDGTTVLNSGSVQAAAGGTPVDLPLFTTSGLSIGAHTITVQASDGVNPSVSKTMTVTIIDTTAPSIAPVANKAILWPPNGAIVPVTIEAHAVDNSGLPVALAVSVACNESGSGFWTAPVIDQTTGTISLDLLAARAANDKDGRQYTITITATDQSGNTGTANVKIVVPHDQGK